MKLKTRPSVLLWLLALSALCAGQANANDRYERRYSPSPRVYYDYAPVLDVRPLREPATVPAACLPGALDERAVLPNLGVVREHAASIASAIVQEAEAQVQAQELARDRRDACERERVAPRVTGYEVLYRYQGTEYRRVMTRDPGEEVRVRVEVRAP